jgi:hypothetical protein
MFKFTQGSARERLNAGEVDALTRTGALIRDERRKRPLYFDGRFLAARDLTRDQNYFLTRQADLGRAGGYGVVHGLHVQPGDGATRLEIGAGHGITPVGELVVLPESLTFDVSDLARIQTLDRAFGLLQRPNFPARNSTGLYVVVLRPIEFTANKIASYPTSITGERSTEDGDIVEGVAVTLVPYSDTRSRDDLSLRRADVAREIFLERAQRPLPAGALPLALVALNRGIVEWVDEFMLRREVGAEHADVLGLGFAPRLEREAHLRQYNEHLRQVLAGRERTGRGRRFAAAEEFLVLPPAGPMPREAIDPRDFSQIFFPAAVDAEISIVPEDEIPLLLEESLLLPPIDLALADEQLESTAVLVLVPIPRVELRRFASELESQVRLLRPPAPGLVARLRPLEALRGLRPPTLPGPVLSPEDVIDAAWRRALSRSQMLWYVRRRNLAAKAAVVGLEVPVMADDLAEERALGNRLRDLGLFNRLTNLKRRGSAIVDAEIVTTLASPKLAGSRILLEGALREFESPRTIDRFSALRVSTRFGDPQLGEGIARLEAIKPSLGEASITGNLARAEIVPELDRLARAADDETLAKLADELEKVARTEKPEAIAAFVMGQ